jgi:hypothetical protein
MVKHSAMVVMSFMAVWPEFKALGQIGQSANISELLAEAEKWVCSARPAVQPNTEIRKLLSVLPSLLSSISIK